MNKIKYCLLMVVTIILLTGCAKCISTEYSSVDVKITDEYHRASYNTTMMRRVGKVMTPHIVHHPAVYKIEVEYDGIKYSISGNETYYKYKDSVGETVKGNLETKKYDDGSVRHDIIGLK